MVRLSCNETVPADMVVLKSSDENNGLCYLDTQNLDGEANLKQRNVPTGFIDEVMVTTCIILPKVPVFYCLMKKFKSLNFF